MVLEQECRQLQAANTRLEASVAERDQELDMLRQACHPHAMHVPVHTLASLSCVAPVKHTFAASTSACTGCLERYIWPATRTSDTAVLMECSAPGSMEQLPSSS